MVQMLWVRNEFDLPLNRKEINVQMRREQEGKLQVIILKWELAFVTEEGRCLFGHIFDTLCGLFCLNPYVSLLYLISKLFSFPWVLMKLSSVIKSNDANVNTPIHWFIHSLLHLFNHSTFIKQLHHFKGISNEYGFETQTNQYFGLSLCLNLWTEFIFK